MAESDQPAGVAVDRGVRPLADRLEDHGLQYGERLYYEAAAEIRKKEEMLNRMDSELRNERDPRAAVQRALLIAAMLPHNHDKPAGAVRNAAVDLFGQEAVDAALKVWRSNGREA